MQKNAFHEIWTLLFRTFLRGRHAGGYGKVQGLTFCVCNKGIQEGHIQKKKEWIVAIIVINSGSGDNRAAKVAADIFNYGIRITLFGLA